MCNGFADICESVDGGSDNYQCRCQHNTCGARCDKCCPGYVQKKWRPRQGNDAFVCERKYIRLQLWFYILTNHAYDFLYLTTPTINETKP